MAEGWAPIPKGKSGDWCIYGISGTTLTPKQNGNGIAALRSNLDPAAIQFAAIRVGAVDDLSTRDKYVQINWIGPKVPAMKRSGALSYKQEAGNVFSGIGVFVDTNDTDDLSEKSLAGKLIGSGGAHKPHHYDFGDKQFSLTDL